MTRIIKIIFLILICFSARSQSPTGLPTVNTPQGYYNVGWYRSDSGIVNALGDTTVRSRFAGLQIFWQHSGSDSNIWFFDGVKYFRYLRTAQDIINVLGYVPSPAFTLTTIGSSGPATYTGNVLNIPSYTGGGGGGIGTLNGLTAATQTFATGTAGTDFNIVSSISTHTFNFPTASASNRGLLGTADFATFAAKQPQINGTGFVKATGTIISFDNTVYYPNSNPNSFISRTGVSANPPILYNSSTGVFSGDTSAGLTHFATQAFVLANQAAGTITGAGNLVPLFSTSVSGNTLIFALTNAAANTALTNSTGSPAAPAYGKINNATLSNSSVTIASTDFSGAGSVALGATLTLNINNNAVTYGKIQTVTANKLFGNPTGSTANGTEIPLGFGLKFVAGALVLDTANLKDTIFAANGLTAAGLTGDSIILGGRLYQNTTISGANAFALILDSFPAAAGRGLRWNLGSDAGYDLYYRDSVTNFLHRLAKGTPGQFLHIPLTGGYDWAAASGGGSGGLTTQRVTSGSSGTVTGSNYQYVIDPSSTLSAYAATLPASPTDGQVVVFLFGGTLPSGVIVTSMSVIANSGQAIIDNTPVTAVSVTAGNSAEYRWVAANSSWYRFKP